jgi:hypothetical protein
MSPFRTDTDTTSGNSKLTLEELDFFKEESVEKDIPSKLLGLFPLVHDVEHTRWEGFAGCKDSEESNINQRNWAAHDYNKYLASRASDLLRECDDPSRENSNENEWMMVLTQNVFHQFDREEEEGALYHHWYVFPGLFMDTDLQRLCLPPSLSAGKPADYQQT